MGRAQSSSVQSGILTCDMRLAKNFCARASGQAPWRQEPSSALLSLQKAQAHLLAGNQDNAGHRLHFAHPRSQNHLIFLYQLAGREGRVTGLLISNSCSLCRLLPWISLPLLSPKPSILPDPHSPPHIPCSPLTATAASPVPQSCGPGRTEPHSRRAQSRMGVGSNYQPLSSSAIGEAGSCRAQERHWDPGTPRSGITQTVSTEGEWRYDPQPRLQALLGTWVL